MDKTIINAETGEITYEDFTDEELAKRQKDHQDFLASMAEVEVKAIAKAAALAKLQALGLTVEDLQALGL